MRYSIEDFSSEKQHGGVLVARTLAEQGVKIVFAAKSLTLSKLVSACKVRNSTALSYGSQTTGSETARSVCGTR